MRIIATRRNRTWTARVQTARGTAIGHGESFLAAVQEALNSTPYHPLR